jgi:hypothetical protein
MLIKSADDRQRDIVELERLLDRRDVPQATRKRIEAEIRQIQAGEKAERDAAYLVDLYFGRSENWAVIHDLRVEVGEHAAQIDHLIINRLAQVWVCESKSFAEGVSVNEYGEWSRWWRGRPEGIPSPIEQNRRHILLLQRAFDDGLMQPPKRLGLVRRKPEIKSLVLVSDNARIGRPKRPIDGLDQVVKAEQLRHKLEEGFDKAPPQSTLGIIGKEGLEAFARELAALHRPASRDWAARFGLAGKEEPPGSAKPEVREPAAARRPWTVKYDGPCARCGRVLTKGTEAFWSQRQRKMLCLDCAGGGAGSAAG